MPLNRFFLVSSLVCLAWVSLAQAEYASQSALAVTVPEARARVLEPILSTPLRDPSVCRGPAHLFYMTGSATSSRADSNSHAVSLWCSSNLLHWKPLGQVWAQSEHTSTSGVCSPEIHYIKGTFYVVYAQTQGGIGLLRSDSGAQGPYDDLGIIHPEGHQPSLFENSRGQVYLLFDTNKIALFDLDKVTLKHAPRALRWEGMPNLDVDAPGHGGLYMFEKNHRYCLFYSVSDTRLDTQTQDTYVAQGRSPYGPFEPAYLAIPHASQACVFQDDMGHVWATFFAKAEDTWAVPTGRTSLVPMAYTDEGRFRPQSRVILERGPVAQMQPRLNEVMMSPSVTLGHDGQYYMVSSNSSWQAPKSDCQVTLWRSRDLMIWEPLGDILTYAEDLVRESYLEKPVPLMSAELFYSPSRDTYFLLFTTLDTSAKTWLFRSMSEKPEGPYENVRDSFMVEGVDGFLYEEEETLYLLWSNGKIGKLNQKVTGFTGPPHQLTTEDGLPIGTEGMCLIKTDKHYIWTAGQWHGTQPLNRTYDLVAARSDSLLGPYDARQFVMPHAGHSTLFQNEKHEWHAVFSGHDKTAPFRNRPGIMKLDIKSDGTIIPIPEG